MISAKAAARQMAESYARGGSALLEELLTLTLQKRQRWIARFVNAVETEFAGKRPSVWTLTEFIRSQPSFRPVPVGRFEDEVAPVMRAAAGRPSDWKVPAIATVGELAAWLNLIPNELLWLADGKSLERESGGKLCHYTRRWVAKRDGTFRLIESPKQRLKGIQRAILKTILERIPAHEACHGFRAGRSIVTFARSHVGKTVVLKMDLKDFFPMFSFARVQNLFLTAGYPENVARAIAGLCTTFCPRAEFVRLPRDQQKAAWTLYGRKHLAQGAPTSPMLANLCAFNLDCRLTGLANAAGAEYTRYADDLVFSGGEEFARGVNRFLIHAMAIGLEEGFAVNARKTKVMRQGVSQRAAGLVLNSKANVPRVEFDRLKAILTNCVRRGVASQNRMPHPNFRAHLQGRIARVTMIHPARGEKLKGIFDRILWEAE